MSEVREITSIDQFNSLVTSATADTLVALNFHAPWAAPCAQMNQVFKTLAKQSPTDKTLFITIDAEEYPEITESYDVSAVPFFVLIKSGVVLEKISGADPSKLTSSITRHSGGSLLIPPAQSTTASTSDTTQPPMEEDLNSRLTKLVSAAPVMLFMKGTPAAPQCGFSRQLVALLREREVRYGFFNILADDEVRQGLKTFSDWPTFPQLYVNGQLIGGLDIVREECENDPDFLKGSSA